MNPWQVMNSIYGPIIININDIYQYQPLACNGIPHINDEIQKILSIINLLPAGSAFVDGGANAGLITMPVAKFGDVTVHSFEPQPAMYNALCGTLALNGLLNVRAHRLALGRCDDLMALPKIDYMQPRDFGDVVLRSNSRDREEVLVRRLDDLVDHAKFIKLDVERMELDALHGAAGIIIKCRPWCWVEHIRVGIDALAAFFAPYDYRLWIADCANLVAVPDDTVLPWMEHRLA